MSYLKKYRQRIAEKERQERIVSAFNFIADLAASRDAFTEWKDVPKVCRDLESFLHRIKAVGKDGNYLKVHNEIAETDIYTDIIVKLPVGFISDDFIKLKPMIEQELDVHCTLRCIEGVAVVRLYKEKLKQHKYPIGKLKTSKSGGLEIAFGMTCEGPAIFQLSKYTPMMMLCGTTRTGKDYLLKGLIYNLLENFTPKELEIEIYDNAGADGIGYADFHHVTRLTQSPQETLEAMRKLNAEVDARITQFKTEKYILPSGRKRRAINILEYRNKCGKVDIPFKFVALNEPIKAKATLTKDEKNEFDNLMESIYSNAGKAGIYMITVSQRISKEEVSRVAKMNSVIIGLRQADRNASEYLVGNSYLFEGIGVDQQGKGMFLKDSTFMDFYSFYLDSSVDDYMLKKYGRTEEEADEFLKRMEYANAPAGSAADVRHQADNPDLHKEMKSDKTYSKQSKYYDPSGDDPIINQTLLMTRDGRFK